MPDLSEYLTFDTAASFLTLTFLEVVLSVDNIVFVAVAAGRLPPAQQGMGRQLGLWLALVLRVAMLVGLVWITRLDVVLVELPNGPLTIKDAVLIAGGLFLLYKGATEIRGDIEVHPEHAGRPARVSGLVGTIAQIGLVNIVFSLDSVITAVGMARQLGVMVAAVAIATLLMMVAARPVAEFIERRPTAKMLALSFILLIGVALVADGTGFDIPRGYIYFAIAFSLGVEALNGLRRRKRPDA